MRESTHLTRYTNPSSGATSFRLTPLTRCSSTAKAGQENQTKNSFLLLSPATFEARPGRPDVRSEAKVTASQGPAGPAGAERGGGGAGSRPRMPQSLVPGLADSDERAGIDSMYRRLPFETAASPCGALWGPVGYASLCATLPLPHATHPSLTLSAGEKWRRPQCLFDQPWSGLEWSASGGMWPAFWRVCVCLCV